MALALQYNSLIFSYFSFFHISFPEATVGIFIGIYLSKKIDGAKLKPIFGWFVLIMGIYIIIKETVLK